jgi:hypothetical protein
VVKTVADPDLWGHVRFGQDMWRDRSLPRIDPYSFTQDRPWINHEWLSELQMGAAFLAGGPIGLMVLKSLLAAAAIAVIWRSLGRAAHVWRWGAAILATTTLIPLLTTLRPQVWTVLLLALLCRLLTLEGGMIWLIPPLFVAWANLHGGWILGLAILGAWTCGRMLERSADRRLLLVVMLSAAATLVTPYRVELWRFLASTVRLSREGITEWQPVWTEMLALTFWLAGIGFVALSWRVHGRPRLPVLVVIALLAIVAVNVQRLVPLFVLAAVTLLAPSFPGVRAAPVPRAQTMLEVAMCGVGLALAVVSGRLPTCISTAARFEPDPVTFAALIEAAPAGRMITPFNWGEAALARLGPSVKVSIDGRRETVYSEATLREQSTILAGTPDGLAALERLSPEYVWLPLPYAKRTSDWLKEHGYRVDVESAEAFVAVRSDLPRIPPASIQLSKCYPMDAGA